jgi:tetratricopeptide (TPR) repeat protein
VVPLRLSPLYPMPLSVNPVAPAFLLSYGVVAAFAVVAWRARRNWTAITAACVAFVTITLPMLGAVQNGPQIAADRYTYHAAPAFAMLAGAAYLRWHARFRRPFYLIGVGLLAALTGLTWTQTRVWHDSLSLWSHTLALEPASSIAHVSYADELIKQGKKQEAFEHYERAVDINPASAEGHNNLGVALARDGRFDETIQEFARAVAVKPDYADAHTNWGSTLADRGDLRGAIAHYERAVALDPADASAHYNWGNALFRLGNFGEAGAHYAKSLEIRPDNANAEHNWGIALLRAGRVTEAIEHFRRTLAIEPGHVQARLFLERAMRAQGSGLPTGPPPT